MSNNERGSGLVGLLFALVGVLIVVALVLALVGGQGQTGNGLKTVSDAAHAVSDAANTIGAAVQAAVNPTAQHDPNRIGPTTWYCKVTAPDGTVSQVYQGTPCGQ